VPKTRTFNIPRVVRRACRGGVAIPFTKALRQRIADGKAVYLRADFDAKGHVLGMHVSSDRLAATERGDPTCSRSC
jgi:hypothetical protein